MNREHARPTIDEYIALRAAMGWGRISPESARKTLEATTFCLCLRDGPRLAGLVRFLGDGCLYLFLADLMVHPDYAGQGLGADLLRVATEHIEAEAEPTASVTLLPIAGSEGFYERFGFEKSPCGPFGHGMAYLRHLG